jgi:type IV pilus assembly protein PilC
VQCLEILGANQENPVFSEDPARGADHREGGATLANAMRTFPIVFDDLTTNMIEAGETGGILDIILQRPCHLRRKVGQDARGRQVGIDLSRCRRLSRRGDCRRVAQVVVPIFANLFVGLGVALPLPTRITIGLSAFIGTFWWVIIGAGVGVVFGVKQVSQAPRGAATSSTPCCSSCRLSAVAEKNCSGPIYANPGHADHLGVPILEGLAITARTSGNAVLEEALMKVRKAIEEGRTIVDPLRECGVFPNMVTQMIGVGEATGAMDSMLQKIADFYEDEVDSATKDMLAMLEPAIIGLLGVSIGGIIISLYMPLFAMIGKLAG